MTLKLARDITKLKSLDRIVAEFAGYVNIYQDTFDLEMLMGLAPGQKSYTYVPSFSESIADSIQLLELAKTKGWYFELSCYGGGGMDYRCELTPDEDMLPGKKEITKTANNLALTICLAIAEIK